MILVSLFEVSLTEAVSLAARSVDTASDNRYYDENGNKLILGQTAISN